MYHSSGRHVLYICWFSVLSNTSFLERVTSNYQSELSQNQKKTLVSNNNCTEKQEHDLISYNFIIYALFLLTQLITVELC